MEEVDFISIAFLEISPRIIHNFLKGLIVEKAHLRSDEYVTKKRILMDDVAHLNTFDRFCFFEIEAPFLENQNSVGSDCDGRADFVLELRLLEDLHFMACSSHGNRSTQPSNSSTDDTNLH